MTINNGEYTDIGCFTEMNCYADNGSIYDYIVDSVTYNKFLIVSYMKSQKRIAGCPRAAIDCITGEKIADSFSVYTDGKYRWCDFLLYHIEKYNISLPEELIKRALEYEYDSDCKNRIDILASGGKVKCAVCKNGYYIPYNTTADKAHCFECSRGNCNSVINIDSCVLVE